MILRRITDQPAAAGPALDLAAALAAVDGIAETSAGKAATVDRSATFPKQSIAVLREARLLSAAVPQEYGGHGLTTLELSEIAHRLGTLCGSTAMIWAMHQVQLACMTASAQREHRLAEYLTRAAREQHLIASVTSEDGIGGSLRTSRTAILPVSDGIRLTKRAPTVSYAEAADSFLVTARRDAEAAGGDQVLV